MSDHKWRVGEYAMHHDSVCRIVERMQPSDRIRIDYAQRTPEGLVQGGGGSFSWADADLTPNRSPRQAVYREGACRPLGL